MTGDTWVLWLLERYGGKHNVFNPNLIIRKQFRLRDLLRHMSMSGRTKAGSVLDSRRPKRIDHQAECLVLTSILDFNKGSKDILGTIKQISMWTVYSIILLFRC